MSAALFHFDDLDGFPDVISERRAAAVFIGFADAEFRLSANIERTGLTEGLKETVEEDLRLTFSSPVMFFPHQATNSASLSLLGMAGVYKKKLRTESGKQKSVGDRQV